jgi:hypothetical protein
MKFVNSTVKILCFFGAQISTVTALAFHINPGTIVLIISILLFISETFPKNAWTNNRQSRYPGIHCIFAVILLWSGPIAIDLFKNTIPIFDFFVCIMALQLVFVVLMTLESKGLPLEELKHKMFNHE